MVYGIWYMVYGIWYMVLIVDQGKDVCMLVWYNIWYYDIESDGIWY